MEVTKLVAETEEMKKNLSFIASSLKVGTVILPAYELTVFAKKTQQFRKWSFTSSLSHL